MARGRVLQGVLELDTGLPWVRVKLEVNGGPAAREWRVQRPVMMDREGRQKELSLGTILHGQVQGGYLRTRQGRVPLKDDAGEVA